MFKFQCGQLVAADKRRLIILEEERDFPRLTVIDAINSSSLELVTSLSELPELDDLSLYWNVVILNQKILALRELCGTLAIWDAGSGRLMQVSHLLNVPIPAYLEQTLCSDSDGKMYIVVERSDSPEFTTYESSGDCWTKNESMSFSFQSLKSSIGYARYDEIGVGSIHGKWVHLFYE